MGESRRRFNEAEKLIKEVTSAASLAGIALEKLAAAASSHLGADCFLHAELGKAIMQDLGYTCTTVVGLAAWRVGRGDGDAVSHVFDVPNYLPPGAVGLPYHAWLRCGDLIVDLTTYQLRRKAADLDILDGGSTTVDWCPQVLVSRVSDISTYAQVCKAAGPGVFFYQPVERLQQIISASAEPVDAEDLAALRLIMCNPSMVVRGPNNF